MKVERSRAGRRAALASLRGAVEVDAERAAWLNIAGFTFVISQVLKPGVMVMNSGTRIAFVHPLDLIALDCGKDLMLRSKRAGDYFAEQANRQLDMMASELAYDRELEARMRERALMGELVADVQQRGQKVMAMLRKLVEVDS